MKLYKEIQLSNIKKKRRNPLTASGVEKDITDASQLTRA